MFTCKKKPIWFNENMNKDGSKKCEPWEINRRINPINIYLQKYLNILIPIQWKN